MNIKESIKNLGWAEFIMTLIFDPRLFAKKISESDRGYVKISFIVPLFVSFALILSVCVINQQSQFFFYKISYGWTWLTVVFCFAFFVFSLSNDFFFHVFGAQGRAGQTLAIVNFSAFPLLFVLPGVMIFSSISFQPAVFLFIFTTACLCWSFFIVLFSVSELRSVSLGRALASILTPLALLGFLFMLLLVSGGGIVFGLISEYL